MDELEFQIEWLKTYAFANKLTWEFQISGTPVSEKFFIKINDSIHLGFTIEEAKTFRNEICLTRHMSLSLNDVPEKLDFDLYLNKFDFDANIPIKSYQQESQYGGVIVHFIQLIK